MRKAEKTKRLVIVMDEHMAQALKAASTRRGCSQGWLVRRALSNYLHIRDEVSLGRPSQENVSQDEPAAKS